MSVSLKTKSNYKKYALPCYRKEQIEFVSGKDSYLKDSKGNLYLDFFSGWAVSSMGHCYEDLSKAIRKQARQLIHLPNNFYHPGQGELAKKIIKNSFDGAVFFCNSGAEAAEGAIKLARSFGSPHRNEIITMEKSFHGRTMGAMSATGQSKFHTKIKPILGGFKKVPFNDIQTLKKAITKKTAAILLEPIQGEGGINIADKAYLKAVRDLCTKRRLLMILDEVQTGMGRTGKMFCFQHYGIKPDVMLLAKALGGGFPMGAFVVRRPFVKVLGPGTHASTFGGSPLACAAAKSIISALEKKKFLNQVNQKSRVILKELNKLKKKYSFINDVRGKGLMLAVELSVPAQKVYEYCLKKKVLINVTQEKVIRLSPPLTIKSSEIKKALTVLNQAMKEV